MRKLIWIIGIILFSVTAYSQIDTIQNNESGLSVRTKLNAVITAVNGFSATTDSSWVSLLTNTIGEFTGGTGVTIDGVKLQDYSVTPHSSYPGQYISADADELSFGAGAAEVLDMKATGITTVVDILPSTTGARSMGSSSLYWSTFYMHYTRMLEQTAPASPSANTGVLYMDESDEHIYFQNSTTTYDLTEGTGGNFDTIRIYEILDSLVLALADSIPLATVAHRKVDTMLFVYGWGDALDSTGMDLNADLGTLDVVEDSLVCDSLRYRLLGTGGDLSFKLYYGVWGTAGTALTAEISIATTDGWLNTTTFEVPALAPGQSIWAEIFDKTAAGTAIRIYFYYHEKIT